MHISVNKHTFVVFVSNNIHTYQKLMDNSW